MGQLAVIKPTADRDLLEAIKLLVADIEAGRVIGVAFVAISPGFDYSGDVVGAALQHPFMALGLAKALEIQIEALLR